ncbi:MAG: hypothetical protein GF308_15850 [Candidatus Heimdallarchaeota archaeon]|nr:hypothetical protein [Candidatus Heimdallarchaeota archaeon]
MKTSKKLMIFTLLLMSIFLTSLLFTATSAIQITQDTSSEKSNYNDESISSLGGKSRYYGWEVYVDHAYYYDLDEDGIADDVLTIITVYSASGYSKSIYAEIYQYLTLPSGKTYYVYLIAQGYDSSFQIATYWYDVATESGWYYFKATVENLNFFDYSYDESSVLFDPPDEAPDGAMPRATVTLL